MLSFHFHLCTEDFFDPSFTFYFLVFQQTHSISHRRAVPGRRKRFDILLKELKDRSNFQQNAPLRDPPPNPQPAPVNRADVETPKPSPLGKSKFHSPGLPRLVLLCHIYLFKQLLLSLFCFFPTNVFPPPFFNISVKQLIYFGYPQTFCPSE